MKTSCPLKRVIVSPMFPEESWWPDTETGTTPEQVEEEDTKNSAVNVSPDMTGTRRSPQTSTRGRSIVTSNGDVATAFRVKAWDGPAKWRPNGLFDSKVTELKPKSLFVNV